MLRTFVRPVLALALAAGTIAFIACDDEDDPADTEAARVALCEDVATAEQAKTDLDALTDANTFAEFDAAADALDSALDDVGSSAEDFLGESDALVEAYITALENLDDALGELNQDMTVADARASIQEEFDAAVAARDALIASANC